MSSKGESSKEPRPQHNGPMKTYLQKTQLKISNLTCIEIKKSNKSKLLYTLYLKNIWNYVFNLEYMKTYLICKYFFRVKLLWPS